MSFGPKRHLSNVTPVPPGQGGTLVHRPSSLVPARGGYPPSPPRGDPRPSSIVQTSFVFRPAAATKAAVPPRLPLSVWATSGVPASSPTREGEPRRFAPPPLPRDERYSQGSVISSPAALSVRPAACQLPQRGSLAPRPRPQADADMIPPEGRTFAPACESAPLTSPRRTWKISAP